MKSALAAAACGALLLLQTGCALLSPPRTAEPTPAVAAASTAPSPVASAAGNASSPVASAAGTSSPPAAPAAADGGLFGVDLEIVAPPPLKALLARHLDLVRLGRVSRDEVDDSEWSRLIEATPGQVRDLLQTEGYFAAKVDVERAAGRITGDSDRVRLIVDPGPRAEVVKVTIEAEGDLERGAAAGDAYAQATLGQLRGRWALPAGSDFRNADWRDAKAAALARLRAAGYANATWSGTGAEVDPTTQRVTLFLVADSGPLFRLGSLVIEGLVAQDAATVRNLAATSVGVPVTETLLLDFQDRLQKAGLFESISVTLDTDAAQAAAAPVLVRLREAPLQVYTFGVGISANNGPRASVEHIYRRVFGYALTARNKFEWGGKRQAWNGEVSTHPYRGLYRYLVGGAVENLETDTDTVLSQRLRVGRSQEKPRLDRLLFLEAERSARTPVGGDRTTAIAFSANFHGAWRDLDSIVLPTQGVTLAIQLGAGRSHATDAPTGFFGRTYGRLTGYLPLGRGWYGQARIELGQVQLQRGVVAPESQLFRAGGDDSVRGYAYRSLGPLVDGAVGGGRSLFTSSIELARPISLALPSLWGAVFADAGNAADGFGGLKPAVGIGVGVRWRSPVGPLRLDWAYGRETHKGRLHFSVGIVF